MNIQFIGMACALGLSALGSAFGAGYAALASVGAWKKCYAAGKPAPFIMVAFSGAPLTQTIYGYLCLLLKLKDLGPVNPGMSLGLGIASGLAMALSAIAQGKAGAAAADAFGETGKGFSQYLTVVGLCETVALFAMVFSLMAC